MEEFTNFAAITLSQGRLRGLIMYLSILSIVSWAGVLITTIIRSFTGLAYKRQKVKD